MLTLIVVQAMNIGLCIFFISFFFQAEDGIRDLVRSRGLGDVYKRQANIRPLRLARTAPTIRFAGPGRVRLQCASGGADAVSYTHLTLPTSDLV